MNANLRRARPLMTGFVRGLLNRFRGVSGLDKNKHRVKHIDGADRVLIDSSVLCCPVCYEVYSCVPLLLRCGHTFCGRCLRQMQIATLPLEDDGFEDGSRPEFIIKCPLCREPVESTAIFKNYVVEDLLKTVDCIADEFAAREGGEEEADGNRKEYTATLRLAKERAERRAGELELENTSLSAKLEESKRREKKVLVIAGAALVAFISAAFLLLV